MSETLDAIYEKGVFKPLKRPDISEGQQVRLIVESLDEERSPADVLELAGQVYQGLTEKEVDEIERIALNRRSLFSR
jgi:predicted DNA-binding antitoxin AbrB/MazE fold protein